MRTDRTTLCADCAVRFPAADVCPRCHGTDLFDLTRPRARREAWHAVQHPRKRRKGRPFGDIVASSYIKYGIALLTLAGVYVGWRFGETWIAAFVLGLAAFWGALALFFVGGGLLYVLWLVARLLFALIGAIVSGIGDRTSLTPRRRIVTIDDQEVLAAPDVQEIRGHVRAIDPLASPLRHAAGVAWRLVGDGPAGNVDDAHAVPFDVHTDDGRTVRIEPRPASIAIEVDGDARTVRPDRQLARFLEARGVYPERGPLHLAEAVLVDGDRVVVEGSVEARAVPEGYRERREITVMRERPGAPLVIRRV